MEATEVQPGVRTPVGTLAGLRVDLPAGMSLDPEALTRCPVALFRARECPQAAQVGESVLVTSLSESHSLVQRTPVFNLAPKPGLPAELGIEGTVPIYLQGAFSWHREEAPGGGDYHEYAIASLSPSGQTGLEGTQLLEQVLVFSGEAMAKGFVVMPSLCSAQLVFAVTVESSEDQQRLTTAETAGGVRGCLGEAPLLTPAFSAAVQLEAETTAPEAANGATVSVRFPASDDLEGTETAQTDPADDRQVGFTLPEGMTLNPGAANDLQACTDAQFGVVTNAQGDPEEHPLIGTGAPVACPLASRVGTFTVRASQLPEEVCVATEPTGAGCPAESEREQTPLTGGVYLGTPLSDEPESGQEFRLLLAAESPRLGVALRLLGQVRANAVTGRLQATIETPQLPFKEAVVRFSGGPQALLDNPLACPPTVAQGELEGDMLAYGAQAAGVPFPAAATPSWPYADAGCPFTPAFAPTVSTATLPATAVAGSTGTFTLSVARRAGDQYLSQLRATLPAGLLGDIAAVPALCAATQANAGSCPPSSALGTATVSAGTGARPFTLQGTVSLTGPYQGAPFGLAIEFGAQGVGPYDFGNVVVRAGVSIEPQTGAVVIATPAAGAAGAIPQVLDGVPMRIGTLTVDLSRAGFLRLPTSCRALATDTVLTGDVGPQSTLAPATRTSSTPFAVSDCRALPFRPSVHAFTSAHSSVHGGAGVRISISSTATAAAFREVAVALPPQIVPRLATLDHACAAALVRTNIAACPLRSHVGSATAVTPLLSGALSGPAILISRGPHELDALAFLLEGDGVSVVLESRAQIRHGVPYWAFTALPDVPVTSFQANFPAGTRSLLVARAPLCHTASHRPKRAPGAPPMLSAPTSVVAQNAKHAATRIMIHVNGCGNRQRR
jgi:hypothetical protein